MEELKALYRNYIQLAQELHNSVGPVQAAFGMRSKEVSHPGHIEFYNGVKAWTAGFLETAHELPEIEQALQIILFSAVENDKSAAVWFLIAAQEHAKPLLDLLPPERRNALRKQYGKVYPRGKRLPLQQELYTRMGKYQEEIVRNDKKRRIFLWSIRD